MLEQAPASTVTLTLECVSPRDRMRAVGRTGRRRRRPAAWAHAWITMLAAALLTLESGCSLLLDFELPIDAGPVDAVPVDAVLVDAVPVDAGPIDALDAGPPDAGEPDGSAGTVSPSDQAR